MIYVVISSCQYKKIKRMYLDWSFSSIVNNLIFWCLKYYAAMRHNLNINLAQKNIKKDIKTVLTGYKYQPCIMA